MYTFFCQHIDVLLYSYYRALKRKSPHISFWWIESVGLAFILMLIYVFRHICDLCIRLQLLLGRTVINVSFLMHPSAERQ